VTYDAIRIAVAKVDALASAAQEHFDNTLWGHDVDRQRLERAANLIGLTSEAAEAALGVVLAANAAALNPAITSDSEPEDF
jgi:hypothetical protein